MEAVLRDKSPLNSVGRAEIRECLLSLLLSEKFVEILELSLSSDEIGPIVTPYQ